MKKITSFIIIMAICLAVSAKQIDEATAKKVGKNFIKSQTKAQSDVLDLQLVYKAGQNQDLIIDNIQLVNYFYIFNCVHTKGFVIVAADDIFTPILGYSINNTFLINNIPANLAWWLQNYCDQIQFAFDNNIQHSLENDKLWDGLLNGKLKTNNFKSSVSPLLQTEWDQSPYYNDLCPDNNTGIHAITGCTATAMAQIMKFWNYPSSGTGSWSYSDPVNLDQNNNPIPGSIYGLQFANFGNTTYNWADMDDVITSPNTAVATLMYHCGVSIETNYSVGASGAYVLAVDNPICVQNALTTYFGYNSTTIQGVKRINYPNDANWITLLKNELDNNRPIQYVGYDNTYGGHTWVCDGYNQSGLLHMNWGWSGQSDGYFQINSLNPSIYNFNYSHAALIGISPPSAQCSYSLSQNSNTYSSIGGTGSFNVNTSTNCNWSASTSDTWIHITSGSGHGNGTISYSVDANTSSNTLYGSITITGLASSLTYNITESGLNCTYSINPTVSNPFTSIGGSGSFSINTNDESCVWSAYSNNPAWLHLTSSSSGNGNSTISYTVDPNLTLFSLNGTISVADQVYTVTQNGASINCEVYIPAGEIVVPNYQYNYFFNYNLNGGCSLTANSSSPDWLYILSALYNNVSFQVTTNQSYYPRTGYIYINGVYKKIIQEGNTSSGINESEQLSNINVYPNPAIDIVFIKLNNLVENNTISIFSTQGQIVFQEILQKGEIILHLGKLSSGLYIMKIENSEKTEYIKFIKE